MCSDLYNVPVPYSSSLLRIVSMISVFVGNSNPYNSFSCCAVTLVSLLSFLCTRDEAICCGEGGANLAIFFCRLNSRLAFLPLGSCSGGGSVISSGRPIFLLTARPRSAIKSLLSVAVTSKSAAEINKSISLSSYHN